MQWNILHFITFLEGFRGFIVGMTHKSTPFYFQTCGGWDDENIICDHHQKKLIVFEELMSSLLGRFYNKFNQFMNPLITRSKNLTSLTFLDFIWKVETQLHLVMLDIWNIDFFAHNLVILLLFRSFWHDCVCFWTHNFVCW